MLGPRVISFIFVTALLRVPTVLEGKIGNMAYFDISSMCNYTTTTVVEIMMRSPGTPSSLIFLHDGTVGNHETGVKEQEDRFVCCLVISVYVFLHRNMQRLCPKIDRFRPTEVRLA